MKKIATMSGKNFSQLYDESTGFSGIALAFQKDKLKAIGYANNACFGGRTVVDCLEIENDDEIIFNRPPVKPSATEHVTISEDEEGNIVVSYLIAGYAFTTRKENPSLENIKRNTTAMHSVMDANLNVPHIEISMNIKYLISTLRNIKKVNSNRVTFSISSEVKPIILKGETGSEKIIMPLRTRETTDGCENLDRMLKRENDLEVAFPANKDIKCPHCGGSLKLYKSRMAEGELKYCCHCGQRILFEKKK